MADGVERARVIIHEDARAKIVQRIERLHESVALFFVERARERGERRRKGRVLSDLSLRVREVARTFHPFRLFLDGKGSFAALVYPPYSGKYVARRAVIFVPFFQLCPQFFGELFQVGQGVEALIPKRERPIVSQRGVEESVHLLFVAGEKASEFSACEDLDDTHEVLRLFGREVAQLLPESLQKQPRIVAEMFEFGEQNFRRAEDGVLDLLGKFRDVDVFEGRAVNSAAFLRRGLRAHEHIFALLQFFLAQAVIKSALDIHQFGRFSVAEIIEYALVDGGTEAALFMQRGIRARERFAQFELLFPLFRKGAFAACPGKIESFLQRAYQRALVRGLARGEFEAEVADPDLVEALFDHGERRLFFRHEEHALARVDGVCDHVGDGLALARSGRTVQDESRARRALGDRFELRTVAGQRRHDLAGGNVVLAPCARFARGQPARPREQRGDERIFLIYLDVVLDVAPHGVAGEGELSDIDVVRHLPALHLRRSRAEEGEYLAHAQLFVFHAAQVDVEFAFQKFEQRRIDGKILVAGEGKAASAVFLQGDGQKDERSEFFSALFFPFQKAYGETERVRARLFQGHVSLSYQRRAYLGELRRVGM